MFIFNFTLNQVVSKPMNMFLKVKKTPWLVWLSGKSAGLRNGRSLVRFPVRAHAWVAGQFPVGGVHQCSLTHRCFSPSLSPFPPLSKNKNKVFKKK